MRQYFNDAQHENPLCSGWTSDFLFVIENDMMQSNADEREEIQTIHDKLKQMRQTCEKSLGGLEYAIQSINT